MMPLKVLFTVKLKDRNDIPGSMEFEERVTAIKKDMIARLACHTDAVQTSFDQASVLYPKRFMFDYTAQDHARCGPRDVINAFFDAIEATGICLSKYDVHITVEWM
jgi:hypothetical protein